MKQPQQPALPWPLRHGVSRRPRSALGLSRAPAKPRGAALCPCPLLLPLLLLLPAARRCQSESARSTAADSAANGPSFRNRYRRCRCSAASARALFPCNSLTYIPAWTSARLLFPLLCFNSIQTKPSLLSWAHPRRHYAAKGLTFS